ncbi:MAG: hypothetical protein JNJ60_22025 [Rhodocyclaceae bacterium]|nr:hypothetical protein [Rhodocyclaceae bacterium]
MTVKPEQLEGMMGSIFAQIQRATCPPPDPVWVAKYNAYLDRDCEANPEVAMLTFSQYQAYLREHAAQPPAEAPDQA